MKIGFDAKRAAQNRTGLGNYSRFVVRILSQLQADNEYHLYVPRRNRTPYLQEIPTLKALRLHFPARGMWRRLASLWRVWGVTADIRADGMDIYHGLSNELPLNIRRAGCRTVVTVHDLIFIHCPEYYRLPDRIIYNYKFRRACRTADRVIAVSEYTKREIMKYYGTPAEKIDVVYQGCDPAFSAPVDEAAMAAVRARYSLPEKYLLYVGSIEERKNLMLVAKALDTMRDAGGTLQGDIHVVVAGRRTAYTDTIEAFLEERGLADRFHFHHSVPFADLPPLYRMATAFVYPSRIEGFGIPLLEAISGGVPAIGCTGSCLEEAGGPGSIYTDPDDEHAMAEAIRRVWTDGSLRRSMSEQGLEYAKRFCDERLCSDLTAVYRKIME